MRHFLTALCLAWLMPAGAAPLVLPPTPPAAITQHLHARLPLSLTFIDESGAPVKMGQLFDRRPVVLVLGYYHCQNLCSTMMEGVLQSLAFVNLPQDAYRIVAVSIDPEETPQIAAAKKAAYLPMLGEQGRELSLLTGNRDAIAELAEAAGFAYTYDAHAGQYAHPAGFLIASPAGEISRYFMGVRFDAQDLRLALTEASDGKVGTAADRIALLCSHYDPVTGRYSLAVMRIVRVACLAVLAFLAAWLWLHRKGRQ